MKSKVFIQPDAENDIKEAFSWYESKHDRTRFVIAD